MQNFCQAYAETLNALAVLPYSRENYLLRDAAIATASAALHEPISMDFENPIVVQLENLPNSWEIPHALWAAQSTYFQQQINYIHQLGNVPEFVQDMYTMGSELINMDNSRQNYELRARTIEQLDRTLQTLSAYQQVSCLKLAFLRYNGENPTQLENTTIQAIEQLALPDEEQLTDEELAALWGAQNEIIQAQSDYAESINTAIIEKRSHLPDESSLESTINTTIAETQNKVGQYTLSQVLTWLAAGGSVGGIIIGVLGSVGLYAIKSLYHRYKYGEQLCMAIKNENTMLLTIAQSYDAYQMRATALDRHEHALAYLLGELEHLESITTSGISDGDLTELIAAVEDLKYNSASIDLGPYKIDLHGKAIDIEGMG
jgi:hypothetical protein